jgi:hypothetical protein
MQGVPTTILGFVYVSREVLEPIAKEPADPIGASPLTALPSSKTSIYTAYAANHSATY